MKVGDKVRIRESAWVVNDHKHGDTGTIVHEYESNEAFEIEVDGVRGYYVDYELEAIEPVPPAFGVRPADLAAYVDQFITDAVERVNGPGAQQYFDGEAQKFERMTPLELVEWAREEVRDTAVYAAMLDIRLSRIADALKEVPVADRV